MLHSPGMMLAPLIALLIVVFLVSILFLKRKKLNQICLMCENKGTAECGNCAIGQEL